MIFRKLLLLTGMMLLTGCSAMTPGELANVRPVSDDPRVGNVYLLRGFIGIFSTGIDSLGDQINDQGVHAIVFQDDQWRGLADTITEKYRGVPNPQPLILIGHSYGADDVVRIARELDKSNIKVDLLVTLDPVTPPHVSKNVVHAYNLYQPNGMMDKLPWLRGIPLHKVRGSDTNLENLNIRENRTDLLEPNTDHFNIEKNPKIHAAVIQQVLNVCLPTQEWLAQQKGTNKPEQRAEVSTDGSTGSRPIMANVLQNDAGAHIAHSND
jgi:hypothetical protein